VDEIFGVLGDALAVLVLVNLEERVARFVFVRESRFTTKHGGAVVVDRSLAGKATDAAMNDTVDGIFDVGVLAVLVVLLVVEERRQLGLDWRLTAKHVVGTVGRAIAWKATGALGEDTVDEIFIRVDTSAVLVLVFVLVNLPEERR